MSDIPDQLQAIARSVDSGSTPKATARDLLMWVGASRRGYRVVANIREMLKALGLQTEPDFEYAWVDGDLVFKKATAEPTAPISADAPDPTYRIGKLEPSNRPPLSVAPDAPLSRAVTLMAMHDYSQLPLMQSERTVKGVITWAAIAQKLALGKAVSTVLDCSAPHHEISSETSLFEAIDGIVKYGYALIRAPDQKISGIVTTTDLGLQFGRLGEPFLLIGEIENYLRRVIGARVSLDILRAAKNPADAERTIDSVEDMNFGEYVTVLEAEKNWSTLNLGLDRVEFTKGLHEIRRIRNDVMHFDPDGFSSDDLALLRRWVGFFQRLASLGAL